MNTTTAMDIADYDFAPLVNAVRALAARCDGACEEDGMGFNGLDAGFGKSLAQKDPSQWTLKMAHAAYKMIRKYKGQLASYGHPYENIAAPPPVGTPLRGRSNRPVTAPSTLTLVNGNFVFKFDVRNPKFRDILGAVKALPGRRFDGATKQWTVKAAVISAEAVLFIAREFEFDIAEGVEEECAKLLGIAQKNTEASRAADAEVEVEGLGGQLRPFQKAGVAYASEAKRVLIADEMGLGKTIQGIATLQHLQAFPALVIVPASVKLNWKREVEKWIPGKTVEVLNGKAGAYNCHVTIVNYDNLHKHVDAFKAVGFEAVIFDEFHYCKNKKTKRAAAAAELAKEIPIRLGLTGTPILNRPAELTNLLAILDRLDDVGGWRKLIFEYAEGFNNGYGIEFPKQVNEAKLEELNAKLRATCLIRRTKKQVLPELPEKTRSDVWLPISNTAAYEKAEALVANGGGGGAEHLTRITHLRQLAAQGKLEAAAEWVENFLDSGEKLVLFAHHIEVQNLFQDRFPGCAVIRGDDNVTVRQANVDRFQNDPDCKLIVCSLIAAREGITLTAASNVAFVELGWTPGGMQQAEDRVHRITQKNAVNVWYLLGEGTIDADMNELLNLKARAVAAISEGSVVADTTEVNAIAAIMERLKAKHSKKGKKA